MLAVAQDINPLVDAVMDAARLMRGEMTTEELMAQIAERW